MPGLRSDAYYEEEFERCWPSWQRGMEDRNLVHVRVDCSVDDLFRHVFKSNSEFQHKAQEARRFTNVQETKWTTKLSALPAFPSGFSWPDHANDAEDRTTPAPGSARKVLFTCPGNALHPSAFQTEQAERCVEYVAGASFVVDVCVLSTPMYCDRFRPIVRYKAVGLGPSRCKLSIDYQIIYVAKVNFVLKKFIERSARGGMEDSFRKWLTVLEAFYPSGVIDMNKAAANQPLNAADEEIRPLKSYRLTDVPTVLEDEEDEGVVGGEKTVSMLLLTLILLVLRVLMTLAAFVDRVCHAGMEVSRRLSAVFALDVFVGWAFTMLLVLSIHSVLTGPLSFLMDDDTSAAEGAAEAESGCSLLVLMASFSVSAVGGLLVQRTFHLRPAI